METTRPSLLIRLKDRSDGDAWRVFDEIYRPMLYRFARLRGLKHADAEDVVQHCLGSISASIADFSYDPTRGRFKSWLRTLVNNRVRNLARQRRETPAEPSLFETAGHDCDAPDSVFDRLWIQEHLWHALAQLRAEVDPATYTAFVDYVIEQRPIQDVCRELRLSPNNVYTIKWRLTQRIADRMRELTGEGAA